MTGSFYSAKRFYENCSLETFRKWLNHHGLPQHLKSRWLSFVDHEWNAHQQWIRVNQCFHSKPVFSLKRLFSETLILHNADKEVSHLMIYCPTLYCNTMQNTWEDTKLFTKVDIPATELVPYLLSLPAHKLRSHYHWGIKQTGRPPYGYGFLKRKKQFQVARTIISYFDTPFANLFKASAVILLEILQYTWPEILGLDKTPVIWSKLHSFLQQDDTEEYEVINDDLVGFFNAIPQERIIQSVQFLLEEYLSKLDRTSDDLPKTLSVNLQLPTAEARVFQGRIKPLENFTNRSIHLEDVIDIVKLSFASGIFTAMQRCFKQIRGSSIGNQISPVLSSIAVAGNERAWLTSWDTWLQGNRELMFCTRYVDNRFCIVPKRLRRSRPIVAFCQPDFYGHPVELENVPDDTDILGFALNTDQRTLTYKIPENSWDYRTPASAGSARLNLGGLRSRACLIKRETWPTNLIPVYLAKLCWTSKNLGFTRKDICKHAAFDRW